MGMQDLAAALGGGGAGGGGGYPPDLGGGGPPPDMGGLPPGLGAPPPDAGAAPPDDTGQGGDQYGTSLEALDGAEQALSAFIQLDPDQGDRAIAAQCLQQILKLKAANQSAVQGGGDMKSLARALQGAGGPGGPGG